MKKVVSNSFWVIVLWFVLSCQENEYDKTATVKFEVEEAVYSEDMLDAKINVVLDRERNVNTIVKISWEALDTTSFYGGDFELADEISIRAFNTTGFFHLSIFNDQQIDPDDKIRVKLKGLKAGDNAKFSDDPKETEFTFTIKNNDIVPTDKLQADLTWHLENPHANIGDINFDLYLQTDVVISNGLVSEIGTTVDESDQPGGFESVWVKEGDPDKEYFVVVYFQQTWAGEVVTFNLNLNGLGYKKSFGGKLADDELGAIFIGPFSKSGSQVQYNGRAGNEESRMYYVPGLVMGEK
jgi:hypothetical protein